LDPGLAAALGVAGLARWVALDYLGHLQPGETVLVLGSAGTAGQMAVQSARILGAGRVVGAARGQTLDNPLAAAPMTSRTARRSTLAWPPLRLAATT
jgi:NADPH:quinone reductase-like Zn-dependent oxidoreductase